jgi:hypothetical protein
VHTYELYVPETYTYEVYAYEMHAYKVRAPETHIYKMHAHEIHAYRYTPNKIHAYKICAYEMRDAGNFFNIKRPYTSPYIPYTTYTSCSLNRNI